MGACVSVGAKTINLNIIMILRNCHLKLNINYILLINAKLLSLNTSYVISTEILGISLSMP